jgi:hypothetical protein
MIAMKASAVPPQVMNDEGRDDSGTVELTGPTRLLRAALNCGRTEPPLV